MIKNMNDKTINIDDVKYNLDELSEDAKSQIDNIRFIDAQLQQLNNEWAIADTARIAYTRALKSSVEDTKKE